MITAEKKDILFLAPPYHRIAPGMDYVKHVTNISPPLGILHLASLMRNDGYGVSIIDADSEDLDVKSTAAEIIRRQPDYLGISIFTVGVTSAAEISRIVKSQMPGLTVIVGGPHISSMATETLERFDTFDYAVPNEGEPVLPDLLRALEAGANVSNVPGVYYRDEGAIRFSGNAEPVKQLDDYPYPAWDLLSGFPERYRPAVFDFPRGPVATISASRGCPYNCTFCDNSTFGRRIRRHSPQYVFNMVKHLHEKYDVRHIQFVDDLFVSSRNSILDFCRLMIEGQLNVTWSCAARIDVMNYDILSRMKEAGCWEISFGLESGSDDMLKKMNKRIDTHKAGEVVRNAAGLGIRCKGLFMLGFPGENHRTINETRQYILSLPLSTLNLSKFTPYPGTEIYRELYGASILNEHWDQMNGMNFIMPSTEGSSIDLETAYKDILTSFYRRKDVRKKYARLAFHHPHHIIRLIKFLYNFIRSRLLQSVSLT